MKSVIELLASSLLIISAGAACLAGDLREAVLRDAALDNGLLPATSTNIATSPDLVSIGHKLFESRLLSFNQDTACASCHLDQFGSADGLPNAIGTEGEGVGNQRIVNGGDIIPRNVLPLWARGEKGFSVLFWDGKVDHSQAPVINQFGNQSPSDDPLVVAAHLPPVEIGEMVIDQQKTATLQTEKVETAQALFEMLADRIRQDKNLGPDLARAQSIEIADIKFLDITEALAAFIRSNFRLKATTFHEFVFEGKNLSDLEIQGGLLFYGRGRCAGCHNGPFFSDLAFHAIPFPQVGFGKNGFGVDYGRFNVTLMAVDQYKFRTPPLYNVKSTSPYSHSGSVISIPDAIKAHVDPLGLIETGSMSLVERIDFYDRLGTWAASSLGGVVLDENDLKAIEAFLGTLSFESDFPIAVVD
jgi:cytochrome c peroxidase